MGTPCSTGAAGFIRLASMHVAALAWPLAQMQRDMDAIAAGRQSLRTPAAPTASTERGRDLA